MGSMNALHCGAGYSYAGNRICMTSWLEPLLLIRSPEPSWRRAGQLSPLQLGAFTKP